MTPTMIFILTTAVSLLTVTTIIVAMVVGKRKRRLQTLQHRVQQLERRELAAANATQDMRGELAQLQSSLAHNQRVLMNNLTGSRHRPSSANTASISRDERKLRELLPQQ